MESRSLIEHSMRHFTACLALAAVVPTLAAASTFEEDVEAYIERYPRQRTYDFGRMFLGGDATRLNTWALSPEPTLVHAGQDTQAHTNADTYYQIAILWLEESPVVVSSDAPSRDRFVSFQFQDDRNVNVRNVLFPQGDYTLYFGAPPDRIRGEAIEMPSPLSVLFVRVEVKDDTDPKDIAAAKAALQGMTIGGGAHPDAFPQLNLLSGYSQRVVDEANRRMDETFAAVRTSDLVVRPGQTPGLDVPYLYHAAGTKAAFGGPDPAHSAYETIFFDKDGNALMGRLGTYTVTTEEPAVDAFWSITVYDTERGSLLHENKHDRYRINDTLAVRNNDGSVTFTFKQACEVADLNCLEVPSGQFDVVARYYLPHAEIVDGTWTFPGIELRE